MLGCSPTCTHHSMAFSHEPEVGRSPAGHGATARMRDGGALGRARTTTKKRMKASNAARVMIVRITRRIARNAGVKICLRFVAMVAALRASPPTRASEVNGVGNQGLLHGKT